VEVEPRKTVELNVVERQALMDTYSISNLRSKDVELFVSNHYIDDAMRAAFDNILTMKVKLASVDERFAAVTREASEIAADQARLRENIKALGETSEARSLIARYVAKAGEQETRLEQIAAERKRLNEEKSKLQSEIDAAIRALAYDRRLKN
jgi:hypothetical protein